MDSDDPRRSLEHLFKLFEAYATFYHNDSMRVARDSTGKAMTEIQLALDIGDEVIAGGIIDLIVIMDGEYYVLDFKTTTWPSRATNEKYRMSHQVSGYVYGAKALLDLHIRGAIIDQVALNQKIVPERDFVRVMTQRTDAQLEEW